MFDLTRIMVAGAAVLLAIAGGFTPALQDDDEGIESSRERTEHEPYISDMFERLVEAYEAGDEKSVAALVEQMESEQTADSYFLLADLYEGGARMVVKDEDRAFRYYQAASRLGSESAKIRLLWMMMDGRGTTRNIAAARAELTRMANEGDFWAMGVLGDLNLYGTHWPVDCDQAVAWYLKAAASEFPAVWEKLARLYHHGTCVEKSPERSAYWASRAAEEGQPWAMEKWASALMHGDGVPQDKVAGYMWLVLAWDYYPSPVPDVYDNLTTKAQRLEGRARAEAWRNAHPDHRVEYPE